MFFNYMIKSFKNALILKKPNIYYEFELQSISNKY